MLDTLATHTASPWDEQVIGAHSSPHFMQSESWAEAKRAGPWELERRRFAGHPVQVFARHAEGFGLLQHLPRVSGITPEAVPDLTEAVREGRGEAFAAKIEVYQPRDAELVRAFRRAGWMPARASQYRHAVVVATEAGEEAAFAAMKKRARNEVRTAERHGVEIERVECRGSNRERMHELIAETTERSGSLQRSRGYLERIWEAFEASGRGALYFARYGGEVVAGAFVLRYGPNAWYKDGGSTREHPHVMASRMLHWHIIRSLAAEGVSRYDLGNIPDPASEHPAGLGLRIFKTGFTRDPVEFLPAFELSFRPVHTAWRHGGEREHVGAYRMRTGDYWY
ncbi:lipid II:glycine glycyltransferase FemX [Agromyces archimandritae]|uniref:GNAT family N-acetyltransferase n=1 Tax=Agromyces archimandritae TaxID=2781962 RepID=A0A975FNW5_9MICO|nr:GNAT family N-acetyltransferase [Agromyces archimandritae]QTX04471.1 GNAT family N-acetyltransferase [Agromyces archimandritae]